MNVQDEGRTILRVVNELRAWIAEAPADDVDAQSLRRDCDTLDRIGWWLVTTTPITVGGIAAAGPAVHVWTPDETKNRCMVCGDGVWGRHRFHSSDPNVQVAARKE